MLVLDLTGGQRLDPIGVLWGLGAAVGLAVFYVLSGPVRGAAAADRDGLGRHDRRRGRRWSPPGRSARCRCTWSFGDVQFAGRTTSWLVPVLGLSVVAAVVSYVAGIEAARRLGARLASFVGLTEVLFAVLFAWLLLGQLPARIQLVGGVLIVAGVALVRIDELRRPAEPADRGEPEAGPASTLVENLAG